VEVNIAQTIPLADGFGMHNGNGGWWVLGAAVMMVFMGGMMWMMMRGMGGGSSAASSAPPEGPAIKESPVEILDRRFAEGEISAEDYRARRELLVNRTAESNGAHKDEALMAAGAEEGKQ
jgi:putative membrane protein